MKKKIILLLILVITAGVSAEERTLLSGQVEHGGFGGPDLRLTTINGNITLLMGGRGGWIINHRFVLGGGGCGVVENVKAKRFTGDSLYVNFGYGGGFLEWVMRSDDLLHVTFSTFLGGGNVMLSGDHHAADEASNSHDGVFVGELNANLELNVVTWFRINFGAGYRYVSGVSTTGFKNSDFGGPTGTVVLKFGKF